MIQNTDINSFSTLGFKDTSSVCSQCWQDSFFTNDKEVADERCNVVGNFDHFFSDVSTETELLLVLF